MARWNSIRSLVEPVAGGAALLVALTLLLLVRLVWVVHQTHSKTRRLRKRKRDDKASLAIFLGSGGHTAEMLKLLQGVNFERYSKRIYIVSSGDQLSEVKALSLERKIGKGEFHILRIPRARKVGQSYCTSIFTTLYSLLHCFHYIALRPTFCGGVFADVVLLNGPGSCVPIVLAALLPRILGRPSPGLVYIESLARTRRLSLSGKLVRFFVDRFFVQWEALKRPAKGLGRVKLLAELEYQGWLV